MKVMGKVGSVRTLIAGMLFGAVGLYVGNAHQEAKQVENVRTIVDTQLNDGLNELVAIAQRKYLDKLAKTHQKMDWYTWNQISNVEYLKASLYRQAISKIKIPPAK